jgi:hypothetical protein
LDFSVRAKLLWGPPFLGSPVSSKGGENTRRNASVRVVWKRPERFPPGVLVARFGGRGMASRTFDVRTGTVDDARSRAKPRRTRR